MKGLIGHAGRAGLGNKVCDLHNQQAAGTEAEVSRLGWLTGYAGQAAVGDEICDLHNQQAAGAGAGVSSMSGRAHIVS